MRKKLLLFVLIATAMTGYAQKSISGTLILAKNDDKDFVLRNTTIMLVSKDRVDSTMINTDLSFSFGDIDSDSVTLFLKSPVVSPNAVATFELRKKKPTKIKLHYDRMHRFSDGDIIRDQEREERFVELNNVLNVMKAVADIAIAVSLIR